MQVLRQAGDGVDEVTITLAEAGDSWEEHFEFRRTEARLLSLEERCSALESSIADMIARIESAQFIGANDGFATYVPRNRSHNG